MAFRRATKKRPHPELGAKRHVEGRTIVLQPTSTPTGPCSLTRGNSKISRLTSSPSTRSTRRINSRSSELLSSLAIWSAND
jgi:hypothetical protein